MEANETTGCYRVLGADRVMYGPVELPALVNWVQDARVAADTWVFVEDENRWVEAAAIKELAMFFAQKSAGKPAPRVEANSGGAPAATALKPGSLRRLKVFAEMEEKQLESFLQYLRLVKVRAFSKVVRKGDHGDAMFLVLEGELRALTIIDGKETTLSTMGVGEFFGEISLLDQGPRSVDVVANQDSLLLQITAAALDQIAKEAPALAAPFLLGLCRTVVGRVRSLTKRYEDTVHMSRVAGVRLH